MERRRKRVREKETQTCACMEKAESSRQSRFCYCCFTSNTDLHFHMAISFFSSHVLFIYCRCRDHRLAIAKKKRHIYKSRYVDTHMVACHSKTRCMDEEEEDFLFMINRIKINSSIIADRVTLRIDQMRAMYFALFFSL